MLPTNYCSASDTGFAERALSRGEDPAHEFWPTSFVFLISSSVLFAVLFEWPRYQTIMSLGAKRLALLDNCLLLWLLVAKSMLWFMPLLVVGSTLRVVRPGRMAMVVTEWCWISFVYFTVTDLISLNFTGYHSWEYWVPLHYLLSSPGQYFRDWAAENLTPDVVLIFGTFLILGHANFLLARWTCRWLEPTCSRTRFTWLPTTLASAYVFIILGVGPALAFFSDFNVLDRVASAAMPTKDLHDHLLSLTESLSGFLGRPHREWATGLPVSDESHQARHLHELTNWRSGRAAEHSDHKSGFTGAKIGPANLVERVGEGAAYSQGHTGIQSSSSRVEQGSNIPTRVSQRDSPGGRASAFTVHAVAGRSSSSFPRRDSEGQMLATRFAQEAVNPGPMDSTAFVKKPGLPNIILIIFESFRHTSIEPSLMRDLDVWSRQGIRLQRHYSGSNCSHLGLFSLFYGRSPLGYYQTLDRKIPPQLLESLRRSGYWITFLTSGEIKGHRRLDDFINSTYCNQVVFENEISAEDMSNWPDSDRGKLARARKLVSGTHNQPQFIFFISCVRIGRTHSRRNLTYSNSHQGSCSFLNHLNM